MGGIAGSYGSSVFSFLRNNSGPFVFPYKLKNFCSGSVENAVSNLIGLALSLQIALGSVFIEC